MNKTVMEVQAKKSSGDCFVSDEFCFYYTTYNRLNIKLTLAFIEPNLQLTMALACQVHRDERKG